MKANELIIGQKYIWRRNSSTQQEATFIGVDESGKYTQYVFEYEKQGEKYYTYLSGEIDKTDFLNRTKSEYNNISDI